MGVRMITDSTADITPAEAKEFGLTVVALKTIFEDGEYLDGIDLTVEEFYQKQAMATVFPKTTQPTPSAFEEVFSRAIRSGDSVICVLISSLLSGTVQSATIAKEAVGGDILIVDSGTTTIGLRLLVHMACSLRDQGRTAAEIAAQLEQKKSDVRVLAVLDTLEYLKKGGRLSKTAAFAGTLLDMKPIIRVKDGTVEVQAKVRGTRSGYEKILEMAVEDGMDFTRPVCLGYTGDKAKFEPFAAQVVDRFKGLNPEVSAIGSVIGAHAGPGSNAIAYFKK